MIARRTDSSRAIASRNRRIATRATSLMAFALVALPRLASADPDQYVHLPGVEYGEKEIEFRFGTQSGGNAEKLSAAALAFGYSPTTWWATEISGKVARASGEGTRFDEFEWENRFQLSEPGEYFVDMGFLAEIEIPREHAEGNNLILGPLFQKDFGPVQGNFNVLFERRFHADEPQVTQLGYEWQLKYRWRPEFEFGAQGFGNLGKWDHWSPGSEQEHKLGPAVFGKVALGGRNVLRYNAAWLFGASDAAPRNTFRVQTEIEF
jgi:hypothetical protein